MPEQRSVTVYTFAELSETAKERAIIDDQASGDWARAEEYMDSLKALAKHFDARLRDWSIDWASVAGSSVEFETVEQEESGLSKTAWEKHLRAKLRELGTFNRRTLKGRGDCKLTGTCYDENAIDGLRFAFYRRKERNLNALLQAAFDTWIKSAVKDWEYDYGEGYAETTEANGWRYLENGKMAPRGA